MNVSVYVCTSVHVCVCVCVRVNSSGLLWLRQRLGLSSPVAGGRPSVHLADSPICSPTGVSGGGDIQAVHSQQPVSREEGLRGPDPMDRVGTGNASLSSTPKIGVWGEGKKKSHERAPLWKS